MNRLTRLAVDDPLWAAIRAYLEERRQSLSRELRGYPQPIAGCDVQFNHLSDQREGIIREIERLDAAQRGSDNGAERFIRSSSVIDGAAAERIRATTARSGG